MKKYFISGVMLAGLMSLAACSNDEGVVADNNGAEQQFTITLASSGDRATRAAADRTLESEAAGQSIEKVTLIVRSQDDGADKNKVVYTYTLDNYLFHAVDSLAGLSQA
jgi:predicted small lipoprotein YifL